MIGPQETEESPEAANETLPPLILRMKDLQRYLRCGPTLAYKIVKTDPDFPPRIWLSSRSCGWLRSDVVAWAEKRRNRQKPRAA